MTWGKNDEVVKQVATRPRISRFDMPVSVLTVLRQKGLYRSEHRTKKLASWAIPDVKNLLNAFLKLAVQKPVDNDIKFISMKEIAQKRFKTGLIKSEIYIAIIKGELKLYGNAERLGALVLDSNNVNEYTDW